MATKRKPNVKLKITSRNNPNGCRKSESNILLSSYMLDTNQADINNYTNDNDQNPFKSTNIPSGNNDTESINTGVCSKSLSESSQNLRIVVLGSSKVGKTSLIEQLMYCHPLDKSKKTITSMNKPTYHYPIVIFNEHVYNIRLIDCPVFDQFPCDSLQDWTILGGCNLREASGFILMFDVTSEASFQHIKSIREQIIELNIEVPMVIAANKVDLMSINGKFVRNNKREMCAIVKKPWKGCVLIECSTKYNWRVLTVFKELMRLIDSRDNNSKPNAARAMHNAFRRNQCCVM